MKNNLLILSINNINPSITRVFLKLKMNKRSLNRLSTLPCKFDKNCTREDCHFQHTNDFCSQNNNCSNQDCQLRHTNIFCKKNNDCTREDCFFRHFVGFCRQNTKCQNLNCQCRHSVKFCRLDTECERSDCLFRHSTIFCRYNDKCTLPDCKFRHTTKLTNFLSHFTNPTEDFLTQLDEAKKEYEKGLVERKKKTLCLTLNCTNPACEFLHDFCPVPSDYVKPIKTEDELEEEAFIISLELDEELSETDDNESELDDEDYHNIAQFYENESASESEA